jgi:hypothetical protein
LDTSVEYKVKLKGYLKVVEEVQNGLVF